MMIAYLIDPETKSITEVQHDDSLNDIKELLQCTTIDMIRIDGRDGIYIDDEGLYKSQHFFRFRHYPSPIAGRGLVLGSNKDGYSIAPEVTTMESLEADIHWITREDAIKLAKRDDNVKEILAAGNPSHIVVTAADIIEDAVYGGESKQGE